MHHIMFSITISVVEVTFTLSDVPLFMIIDFIACLRGLFASTEALRLRTASLVRLNTSYNSFSLSISQRSEIIMDDNDDQRSLLRGAAAAAEV